MDELTKLLGMYESAIVHGRKSAVEMIAILEHDYDIRSVELGYFGSAFKKHLQYNTLCSLRDSGKTVDVSAICYSAFVVENNEKSAELYSYIFTPCIIGDLIYVIVERSNGYIFTNNNFLLWKLRYMQGITSEEYKNRGYELISYLHCLDGYMLNTGNNCMRAADWDGNQLRKRLIYRYDGPYS